ncbi:protein-lysine methyltransferase METTL21E [Manihot esculenta]|uniref:Methyltransferase small domain-containing protein n=1 Tax=Manihot esculenta TaxID=3983 RepID=A0A2C9WMV7_MANES|nr:protein-lysine methyltransferase METTL21E [Manihot esculenta]OAY60744.1 hypothetical protein MANES_01G135600v8 [Manihot esculenta]
MASTEEQQEDDLQEIDPISTLLLPQDHDNALNMPVDGAANQQLHHHHHISSIDSTVLIRQLPSQGLSFQLWPAATTLLTLLDHHSSHSATSQLSPILAALSSNTRPLNVLELGSGTGLAGIAAAITLGANVTVTDLPNVIPNLQFNVDANANTVALHGGSVKVAPLRWGEDGDGDVEIIGKDFDLILASDVVYHDHLFEPLLYTLRVLMGLGEEEEKKKVFVMGHLRRWKKDSVFFRRARKWFDVEAIHKDSPCDGSRIGVAVYSFVRKGQKL